MIYLVSQRCSVIMEQAFEQIVDKSISVAPFIQTFIKAVQPTLIRTSLFVSPAGYRETVYKS